jgi:hypothetical protein
MSLSYGIVIVNNLNNKLEHSSVDRGGVWLPFHLQYFTMVRFTEKFTGAKAFVFAKFVFVSSTWKMPKPVATIPPR